MIKATAWTFVSLGLLALAPGELCAQVNFGYVPVGSTNTATGYYFSGGSWNGANLVMAIEEFIGPNAGEFSVSPNYAGQSLAYGVNYPYSISFAPTNAGLSTAILTNLETPDPPLGRARVLC